MNQVTFPGLGLEFNLSKIAITIFDIPIAWYAILIVSAFIIALIICKIRDNLYDIKFQTVLELALYVIPISIICARIYYVAFKLDYFLANPGQLFNIKNGGLAIYGGIIGGAITCYIFAKKKKINFLDLLDYIVPVLALRTSNRQMGQFYKCRSLWNRNHQFITHGNIRKWHI